jgi:hypothetical protein
MRVRLQEIALGSGQVIDASADLTVIVGPNNVGKSVLLSSTWAHMAAAPDRPPVVVPVVSGVQLSVPPVDDIVSRVQAVAKRREAGQYPQGHFYEPHFLLRSGQVLTQSTLHSTISAPSVPMLGDLANVFTVLLPPEARLGQSGNTATPNLLHEEPSQPLQAVWADRQLEDRVRKIAQRAFGIDQRSIAMRVRRLAFMSAVPARPSHGSEN